MIKPVLVPAIVVMVLSAGGTVVHELGHAFDHDGVERVIVSWGPVEGLDVGDISIHVGEHVRMMTGGEQALLGTYAASYESAHAPSHVDTWVHVMNISWMLMAIGAVWRGDYGIASGAFIWVVGSASPALWVTDDHAAWMHHVRVGGMFIASVIAGYRVTTVIAEVTQWGSSVNARQTSV